MKTAAVLGALLLLLLNTPSQAARRPASAEVNLERVAQALILERWHCRDVSATKGLTCFGVANYGREMAIVIPPGYVAPERLQPIVHLHGHNEANTALTPLLDKSNLAPLMAATGRTSSILLMPWSTGLCADFEYNLVPNFEAWMGDITALAKRVGLVSSSELGSLVLSGHSGAYRSLAAIIEQGKLTSHVSELYLIEATYGRTGTFQSFAADKSHRFWSVYPTDDAKMSAYNPAMMDWLRGQSVPFYFDPEQHEPYATAYSSNRVGFVVTDVGHNESVGKYWAALVGAGGR